MAQAILPADALSRASSRLESRLAAKLAAPQEPDPEQGGLEKKLLEYERHTRELAESLGLARVRRKYSPDNLEWFVLYQFAGMTSNTIADRYAGNGKAFDESTYSMDQGGCEVDRLESPGPTIPDREPESSMTT